MPSDAATAEALRLVNRVVEPDALEGAASEIARRLAAKPPEAMRLTKRLLRRPPEPVADRMAEEAAVFARRLASDDVKAAIARFFASRAPRPDGTR